MLIAQLSDIHICRAGQLYMGVADSNAQFVRAIDHLHGLDRRPDLVVVTGDITADGKPAEFAVARELLSRLEVPYLVIPGNHDDRETFRAAFSDQTYLPASGPLNYCFSVPPVRIIGLDCTVPGRHHGELDADAFKWLEATLDADRATPTFLLMHHPPFLSGIGYLDQYRFHGDKELSELLGAMPNIEAVLCGHVHRLMMRPWAGTMVLTCPSTTTEIALKLDPNATPESSIGPPACLLHLWSAAQGLVTHASHIGSYPGPYAFF